MFKCDDCHNPKNHRLMFRHSAEKLVCEICNAVAYCIDCKIPDCLPPDPSAPETKEETAA